MQASLLVEREMLDIWYTLKPLDGKKWPANVAILAQTAHQGIQ